MLGRALNDDLDERSLEDGDRVRRACSAGGQDRDTDAQAREQNHPAEGEKDLRERTRARPASNRRGLFVVTPFGWSGHGGLRSIALRSKNRRAVLRPARRRASRGEL
jgi:hypothetical protein